MTATTTVYLVRHGDVENPEKVYYGRLPGFPLNERGREQARAAGRHLSDRSIAIIYASPRLRAQETARIIQSMLESGPRLRSETQIDEVRSRYDGAAQAEMERLSWNFYRDASHEFEQPQDVLGRVKAFMQRARSDHYGQEVVAVSHADPIVFYWMWVLGIPLRPENRRLLQQHGLLDDYPAKASISRFQFETVGEDERPAFSYVRPY